METPIQNRENVARFNRGPLPGDIMAAVDAVVSDLPETILSPPLARGEADMVVGTRFLDPWGPEGFRQSPTRMAGIRVLSLLFRLLTGSRFTDCTSGFRAVNREVIRAFSHWYPDDHAEPEVILLLQRAGFRVVEVPVRMKPRAAGRSSIPLLRGLFYVIKVSVTLVLDTMRRPWPKGQIVSTKRPNL